MKQLINICIISTHISISHKASRKIYKNEFRDFRVVPNVLEPSIVPTVMGDEIFNWTRNWGLISFEIRY